MHARSLDRITREQRVVHESDPPLPLRRQAHAQTLGEKACCLNAQVSHRSFQSHVFAALPRMPALARAHLAELASIRTSYDATRLMLWCGPRSWPRYARE